MIYIPFLYFIILFFYILRTKKSFEISALITIAYITTSFFAIIIDKNQLYGAAGCVKASIDFTPTLIYCLLITLTILPFTKLPTLSKDNIILIKNVRLLNFIVYSYLVIFILFIYFFGAEIVQRIKNPDIAALRLSIVNGEDDLGFSNYSGITRVIARLVFIFGSSAMFLQVIYFYSLAFLKKSTRFNLSILVVSTMPIIISMLSMDRSKLIYWLMSFIAIAVFFWPTLSLESKKKIKSTFIIFTALFSIYLIIITIARYGSSNLGAGDSLIVYAGQSFNNFCLFFDKLRLSRLNFEHITPLLYNVLGSTNSNSLSMSNNYAIDTNVFASFIGMMIKEIGIGGAIIYCSLYFLLAMSLFKKKRKYNITKIFLVIILLYIPYLGIFGLFYSSIEREITVWVILIICYFLSKRVQPKTT